MKEEFEGKSKAKCKSQTRNGHGSFACAEPFFFFVKKKKRKKKFLRLSNGEKPQKYLLFSAILIEFNQPLSQRPIRIHHCPIQSTTHLSRCFISTTQTQHMRGRKAGLYGTENTLIHSKNAEKNVENSTEEQLS